MSTPISPLLQVTRIWKDDNTKKEHKALACLRWRDVNFIEEDVNSGLDRWEHKGPITYIMADGIDYHVLGEYKTWLNLWLAYTASAQNMLLPQN